MRLKNTLLAAILTLTSWQVTALFAQDVPPAREPAQPPFGGGTLRLRDADEVRTLRNLLQGGKWVEVVREFFDDLYDESLADLVVYIPASGHASSGMVHGGKEPDYLEGKKHIWIVAFSDEDLAGPVTAFNDSTDVTLALQALDYRRDPVLSALVKAIGTFFSGAVPDSKTQVGRDSALHLQFRPLAKPGESEQLYVLLGGLPIVDNTTNRVSIFPGRKKSLPDDHSIHFFFGNASSSGFGASLAAGLTVNASRPEFSDTIRVGTEPDVRPSLYLFGHLYLRRPRLPWDSRAVGLAVGTNVIRGGILDDIVFGISVGRFKGIGLITGVNWLEWKELDRAGGRAIVSVRRRWRWFFGADFAL